jgi:REJ domain
MTMFGFSVCEYLYRTESHEGFFQGRSTSNFTSTRDLFLSYPSVRYWRFEAVYNFLSEQSRSALNFVVNQPPSNGSCSIYPLNGTIITPFTVSCPHWFDDDNIKDYSLYSKCISLKHKIFNSL